jgi:hypothetical protein
MNFNRRIEYPYGLRLKMAEAMFVLHAGDGGLPLVRIAPDASCPRMWRMHWPDGQVSDIGELTQIRDEATAICERGPPARDRRSFKWTRIYRNLHDAITEAQARSEIKA